MLTTLIQSAPAETSGYMFAGYAVIFGVMFLYVLSLVLRTRNLKRVRIILKELEKKEK